MLWVNFLNFSCQVYDDGLWLLLFVAIGKFFNVNGKIMLSVSVTVHHAVCDGYHVSKFFEYFEKLAINF